MLILGAILSAAFDTHERRLWVGLVARKLWLKTSSSLVLLLLMLKPRSVHSLDCSRVLAVSTHGRLLWHCRLMSRVANNFRLTSRLFQMLQLLLGMAGLEYERWLILALATQCLLLLLGSLRPFTT